MNKNYILYSIIWVLILIIGAGASYIFMSHMNMNMEGMDMENGMNMWTDTFPWYDQGMADHCVMMAEMAGCEPYNELRNKNASGDPMKMDTSFMDIDPATLPDARKVETVELKDGDSYKMEVTLVKKDIGNNSVTMLAYNGSVPGPILKAPTGAKINVEFVNSVPWLETTLHSHGLRWDYTMDGVPKDMGGTQDVMNTWDSFTYVLDFPDTGVFWYHPHVREDMQQELGLYGNFIAEPTSADFYNPVNKESTIILDDILMENDKIANLPDDFANYAIMGRFGNTMLINGETDFKLQANAWDVQRLYLTNVANTRVFNFEIPGAKMKLVWGDIGKYEKEVFIDSVIIAPAERYIVEVYFPNSWNFDMQNTKPESISKLWTVVVAENKTWTPNTNIVAAFNNLRTNNDVVTDIDTYRKFFDGPVDKKIELDIDMMGMNMNMMWEDDDHGWIEWEDNMVQMNKMHTSGMLDWKIIEPSTWKSNMDINWNFKVWDVVKVRIQNNADGDHPMQHPIHFHGQRFLVIDENGTKSNNLVWKDTVLVKKGEYVDILIDMSNPGKWMAHCHIAEHLSSRMMMNFTVSE